MTRGRNSTEPFSPIGPRYPDNPAREIFSARILRLSESEIETITGDIWETFKPDHKELATPLPDRPDTKWMVVDKHT